MKQDPMLPFSAVSLRERAMLRLSHQSIPDVTQMSVAELQRWSYELLIEKAALELQIEDLQEALRTIEEKRAESPYQQDSAQVFVDRERLHFQAQLLGAVGEAVIATDLAGTITYFNRAAEALYGWSAQEVIGRNCVDVLTNEASAEQSAEIMAQLGRGESWSGEFVVRRRDHSTYLAMG